jgi:hypothetical protein
VSARRFRGGPDTPLFGQGARFVDIADEDQGAEVLEAAAGQVAALEPAEIDIPGP